MIRYCLVFLLICYGTCCCAQNKRQDIAVYYGIGSGGVGFFHKVDGGRTTHWKSLNTIGISYWDEISKNLYLETGVNFAVYKYTSTSFVGPVTNRISTDHVVKLISVPLKLKYDAGKYIFFNGGISADVDVSKKVLYSEDKYTGIGANIGIGLQYYFMKKLGVYANPQLEVRNLLTFSDNRYKLFSNNFVFGLAYRINN